MAGELARAGRGDHQGLFGPHAAQHEQQRPGRSRISPVEVVDEQHHEALADGVEQAEQLWTRRKRVYSVVEAGAQERRRPASHRLGGGDQLGDDAVGELGLSFLTARPQNDGVPQAGLELCEQA